MQGAQRGKGAAGPPAGTPGGDWLGVSTYETLHQGIGQAHAVGGIILGYVIDNPTSDKPKLGMLLPGTMLCRRITDSELTPVGCSFLVVDSERRANNMFKAYLATGHKCLAKVYFAAKSKHIDSHVVCYEKLTAYDANSKDNPVPRGKLTWQVTTRELFEAVDELLKVNYGRIVLGASENSKFVYYGEVEGRYGFPPIQTGNNANIVKYISVGPLNKNNEAAKKKQLTILLDLIGKIGVWELDDEYKAFQSLAEERNIYNLPILLGHPFPLYMYKERLDIVVTLNEALHDLEWTEIKNYEAYMSDKLPGLRLTWKEKVRERGFVHIIDTLGSYKDTFQELLTLLRNFVTHERDSALNHDLNIAELHWTVYRPFGAFLSWTYTYIHK